MIKGKPWTPATLEEVGGTEGVGVTFLEETFSSPTGHPASAPPEGGPGRPEGLLPEAGTDIKGHMRSYAELLEASGLSDRPGEFDGPAPDPRRRAPADHADRPAEGPARPRRTSPGRSKCYQLTHDYLVPIAARTG